MMSSGTATLVPMVLDSRDEARERAGYDEAARSRWVGEPGKRHGRSAFERDRARVLHSFALRRLAGKTQVVGPGESDFPRTRLTHSLECAQIGRELGKTLGCDPDLVETACLAHDLGHPPFGHNGEAALDAAARGCGGFEGNAQSLRVLTRLEAKTFASTGRSAGLNLTRAALDAATKYPWPRPGSGDSSREVRREPYGVYAADMELFAWVRECAPPARTCLEAQVMDWADDVAYSVHDLEDGVHAGHVDLRRLSDATERHAVCEVAAAQYTDATAEEIDQAFSRLLALPHWPVDYDGGPRSMAALKNLTSQLIGRFCAAAEWATRRQYGTEPLRRYDAELVIPRGQLLECAALKGVAARYVMRREGASELRAHQRGLIAELVAALADRAPEILDPSLRHAFAAAPDDSARLRVIIDQVAALTDTSAVAWHDRLTSHGKEKPHGS